LGTAAQKFVAPQKEPPRRRQCETWEKNFTPKNQSVSRGQKRNRAKRQAHKRKGPQSMVFRKNQKNEAKGETNSSTKDDHIKVLMRRAV